MTASKFSRSISLALCGLLIPAAAGASGLNGLNGPRTQVQGFVAQGVLGSDHNDFFGDSSDGLSADFTEAGLNGRWQPHDALGFSGQLLYRRAGKSDRDGVRVDYAHADWRFYRDPATRLGLRLGKVKIPYGFYNDTRDVPFTRSGILLPQSVYFDNSRDLLLAAPGAFIHGASVQDYGAVEFALGWVRPDFDSEAVEYNFLGGSLPGKLDGRGAAGGRLRWDTPYESTLMLTYADARADYMPATLDSLQAGTVRFSNWLVSAQQRFDTVTLTAEYAEPQVTQRRFGALPDTTSRLRTFYVQGEWRFRADWELMLRHDVLYRDLSDRSGRRFEALTGRPAHGQHAFDSTIGLRWDATPSLMLRAEYHRIDGTGWLPGPDNPDFSAREPRWNLWLLQAAYRF